MNGLAVQRLNHLTTGAREPICVCRKSDVGNSETKNHPTRNRTRDLWLEWYKALTTELRELDNGQDTQTCCATKKLRRWDSNPRPKGYRRLTKPAVPTTRLLWRDGAWLVIALVRHHDGEATQITGTVINGSSGIRSGVVSIDPGPSRLTTKTAQAGDPKPD